MSRRVIVFLDWQNVYRRGRDAFCASDAPHVEGQVDPIALGECLTGRVSDGVLSQVRIYRGIPTNKHDPKGHSSNRRQAASWMKRDASRLHVYLRSLQYLPGESAREKGIDVQLAIDFVTFAVQKKYDVGILFSSDTDLIPALDAVYDLGGPPNPVAQVAAWSGPYAQPRRIAATGKRNVWCNWLKETDFRSVADPVDHGKA